MKKSVSKKKPILAVFIIILIIVAAAILYQFNYIPHCKYSGEHFGIARYVSDTDRDGDGIDDQTDILNSVRTYLDTKPKYKSKYYPSGYPDDEYGVCTDVVAFGLLGAGYDLQELMDADITQSPEDYGIEKPDKNIDFRRVVNMAVYFKKYATSLTTDTSDIAQWQGGDIVIWKHHVGVISDMRNSKGVPFVLHNGSPYQAGYEQDVLENYGEILGHYRISPCTVRPKHSLSAFTSFA
ncbi:MAG: DUF1287 domain-containing protein [Agathobacter sp.]|nr:DUF1287 domain-containing protein [Agathobacter sp.]